jgi:prophage regulatory protein
MELKKTAATRAAIPQANYVDPILRRSEVLHVTGVSRATLYRMLKAGNFPRPVELTENTVGWLQSSVKTWIESRPKVNANGPGNEDE